MVKLSRGTKIEIAVFGAFAAVVVALPFYAQTSDYPIAIVQGNSMYPTLHNGDLEIFGKAPSERIANGTIIVFVQGDTGVTALDSLIRPVVIHRIVGTVVQADGQVYYRTKGDNNQYIDPQLVQGSHVLGTPIARIPYGGVLVLFAESPEGMVALIGMISLYYLGKYEVKLKDDAAKDAFLGELAGLVLVGEISDELFRRLELVVKYGKPMELDRLGNGLTLSLLTWMKKGGLEKGWRVARIECKVCSSKATSFVSSEDVTFTVCRRCTTGTEALPPVRLDAVKPLVGP